MTDPRWRLEPGTRPRVAPPPHERLTRADATSGLGGFPPSSEPGWPVCVCEDPTVRRVPGGASADWLWTRHAARHLNEYLTEGQAQWLRPSPDLAAEAVRLTIACLRRDLPRPNELFALARTVAAARWLTGSQRAALSTAGTPLARLSLHCAAQTAYAWPRNPLAGDPDPLLREFARDEDTVAWLASLRDVQHVTDSFSATYPRHATLALAASVPATMDRADAAVRVRRIIDQRVPSLGIHEAASWWDMPDPEFGFLLDLRYPKP